MTFEAYLKYTESIIDKTKIPELYNDPIYYDYTKLNGSRMKRWLKVYTPSEHHQNQISKIETPQQWIVITEPWCGDAAHIVPIIYLLSKENENIHLDIQLRDEEPFLIDNYLTNGGKSIPKLIIRNQQNEDIAVWGPRPKGASILFQELKNNNASFDEIKIALQEWYNNDKGQQISNEIIELDLYL